MKNMKKLKIYLETTVFNRYFEPERDSYSETGFTAMSLFRFAYHWR